jgi:CRISPR/Cas system-associated exonuclease Cas4 (RecB family)
MPKPTDSQFRQLSPMEKGTLGHSFFETYLKDGPQAMATRAINEASASSMQVAELVNNFFLFNQRLVTNWSPVRRYVEEPMMLSYETDFDFYATPDLVVFNEKTEQWEIYDHKFTQNVWDQELADMSPQLPRYIHVVEQNYGMSVRKASYIFYRTRAIKDPTQKVMLMETKISGNRMRHAMEDVRQAADEIMTTEARPMSLSSHGCKFCSFAPLCKAKVEGKRDDYMMIKAADYTANTYGYGEVHEVQV